jgi:hypothetical protein
VPDPGVRSRGAFEPVRRGPAADLDAGPADGNAADGNAADGNAAGNSAAGNSAAEHARRPWAIPGPGGKNGAAADQRHRPQAVPGASTNGSSSAAQQPRKCRTDPYSGALDRTGTEQASGPRAVPDPPGASHQDHGADGRERKPENVPGPARPDRGAFDPPAKADSARRRGHLSPAPASPPEQDSAAAAPARGEHPHLAPAPERPAVTQGPAEPSWAAVVGNTARLWAQRRADRLSPSAGHHRRQVAVIILVVIVAAAGGLALVASGHGKTGATGQEPGSAANPGAAAITSAVAIRGQAATWVAHQVSRNATVACDPVMCAALHSRGFPAANLVPILPARSDPLGAELVVATAALRNQFGTLLARVYAPQVIASFGTGQARIEIRTIPPEGSAAFRRRLGPAERAARKQGAQLLGNRRIAASAQARAALAGGHVDARLLATLAALAARHPVQIIAFGDANPGAGPAIPFRSADLAGADRASGLGAAAYQRWLVGFLRAQRAAYRATSVTVLRAPGGAVVRTQFAAPSEIAGPGG